jgi:hypothetical protein
MVNRFFFRHGSVGDLERISASNNLRDAPRPLNWTLVH